jgi:hypothetical protein
MLIKQSVKETNHFLVPKQKTKRMGGGEGGKR